VFGGFDLLVNEYIEFFRCEDGCGESSSEDWDPVRPGGPSSTPPSIVSPEDMPEELEHGLREDMLEDLDLPPRGPGVHGVGDWGIGGPAR